DFDILTLAGTRYNGTLEDIQAWLAREFHNAAMLVGSAESVMATSTNVLDMQADITGLKPEHNDPEVKVCAIDQSDYLMRLWPGSIEGREWCLDFVQVNHEPYESVNSPFTFELWTVPRSMGHSCPPWLPEEAHCVLSLENRFRIETEDIAKGAEKFVLNDGHTYLLWRPVPYQSIQFTVPSRPL
ncbi:hypothetical protein BC628DRAFT_1274846, partial [Trametes gibbosa]